jgi:uncharacterized protein YbjQ (UPF0145 family)
MKKLITLCVLIMGSSLLSACQFFIDDRSESLMVVSVDEWAEATHKAALHDEAEQRQSMPVPMAGSELISFTNNADAYLAGCRSLGIIEVHHYGSEDEAMILMRNEAVKLDATAIVPLDFYQDKSAEQSDAKKLSFMKGRVVRCPARPDGTGA